MDSAGQLVVEPQFPVQGRSKTLDGFYGTIHGFSDGLAAVSIGDKWGYIDKNGKYAINPQFEFAWPFFEGLAAVSVSEAWDRWGYIDKTGKFIINPTFQTALPFSEGLAVVAVDKKYGFIDKSGKYVVNPQFDYAMPFQEGMAPVKVGSKFGYITPDGKFAINPQFESALGFQNGLAPVVIGRKWGYIDNTGDIVVNPQFDQAFSFDSNGLAKVVVSYKEGFIDRQGKYVVNPQFDGFCGWNPADPLYGHYFSHALSPPSFSEGLSPIKIGERCGYVDETGKMAINPQFKEASTFFNGLAFVRFDVDPGFGWIDKTGKVVWRLNSK